MADNKTVEKDLEAIRALAEVLEETGLSEIEIERGPLRLRVSRSAPMVAAAAPAPMAAAPLAAPAAAPAAPTAGASDSPPAGAVTSPMVGTAYMSPAPGESAFVNEGSTVKEGQTLMIVEAMKTMNEIKAPHGGTVRSILAKDAEPVEYGETLMIID